MDDEHEIDDLARELFHVWINGGGHYYTKGIKEGLLAVARSIYPRLARPAPDGLELIAEIERLRETLTAVRDTIEHNPDSINEGAIVCTVWFSPIETMVDFIDAALNFHAVGEKE